MAAPTRTTTVPNVSLDTGGLYADNGALSTDGAGNLIVASLVSGASIATKQNTGTAPTIATSGTISTAALGISRVTTGGAVTGVIMQAGTFAGQEVWVVNESANSITFAAVATSNVSNGVSGVIAALNGRKFVWDSLSTPAAWYPAL
jgi:hypothetical protein